MCFLGGLENPQVPCLPVCWRTTPAWCEDSKEHSLWLLLGAVCTSAGISITSVQAMAGYWPEINGENEMFVKCINDACLGGSFGTRRFLIDTLVRCICLYSFALFLIALTRYRLLLLRRFWEAVVSLLSANSFWEAKEVKWIILWDVNVQAGFACSIELLREREIRIYESRPEGHVIVILC